MCTCSVTASSGADKAIDKQTNMCTSEKEKHAIVIVQNPRFDDNSNDNNNNNI